MKRRYIQFSYESEQLPEIREKGVSFKQLIIFAITLGLIVHAVTSGVNQDIIMALILNLLK